MMFRQYIVLVSIALALLLVSCASDNSAAIRATTSLRRIDAAIVSGIGRQDYDQLIKAVDTDVITAVAESQDVRIREHLEKSMSLYRKATGVWDEFLRSEKEFKSNELMLNISRRSALRASEFDLRRAAECGRLGLRCPSTSEKYSKEADELVPKVESLKKEMERTNSLLHDTWSDARRELDIACRILGID
jgi:hypothetical protein